MEPKPYEPCSCGEHCLVKLAQQEDTKDQCEGKVHATDSLVDERDGGEIYLHYCEKHA